jgi:hypothetical protein
VRGWGGGGWGEGIYEKRENEEVKRKKKRGKFINDKHRFKKLQ